MTKTTFQGTRIIERCFPFGISSRRFDNAYPELTDRHLHIRLRFVSAGYDKLVDISQLFNNDNCKTEKFDWYLTPRLLNAMSEQLEVLK